MSYRSSAAAAVLQLEMITMCKWANADLKQIKARIKLDTCMHTVDALWANKMPQFDFSMADLVQQPKEKSLSFPDHSLTTSETLQPMDICSSR